MVGDLTAASPPPVPLRITTLIDTLPEGSRVLDAGCGAGTFPYAEYPGLQVAAVDLAPGPELAGHAVRATASRLPFPDAVFDLVIAHWLFEHVDDLDATLDEVRRVMRPGGLLAVAVPNSHSFEDRAYRLVSHVYKYALLHFRKRIEHVQIITFLGLNQALYRRGLRLVRFREEAAGYCWMEIRQLRPFRRPALAALGLLRRLGIDLFAGANYRLLYQLALERGPGAGYLADPDPPERPAT
ncbi:MAG: class I SAM-dependent methyltransferase [Candidatus Eiseniibacteriota bacterium]|jgi:SAM-dependent methyltransferase